MRLFGYSEADLEAVYTEGVEAGRRRVEMEKLLVDVQENTKHTQRLLDLMERWNEGLSPDEVLKELAALEAA